MWSNRPLGIEELRIFQEADVLVVITHEGDVLSFDYFSLDLPLHLLTQPGDVPSVNASGERRLELRKKFHVLVVRLDVVLAQDAFGFLLLKRIRHFYRQIFICRTWFRIITCE